MSVIKIENPRKISLIFRCLYEFCSRLLLICCICISLFCMISFLMRLMFESSDVVNVIIDTQQVIFTTSPKYLSIAIDSSLIRNGWVHRNMRSRKLITLSHFLAPAYLRVGGNDADRLIYRPEQLRESHYLLENTSSDWVFESDPLFNDCIDSFNCAGRNLSNFTMTGEDWLIINKFADSAGFSVLFDLNVLLRQGDSWDYSNAWELLSSSTKFACNVTWQLGNEPNSFPHAYGIKVTAKQLGRDFITLRTLLDEFPGCYDGSLLVGPDVTRPKLMMLSSVHFMHNFLKVAKGAVSVATFHQYYFNGRSAELDDFVNPKVFDEFPEEFYLMKETVQSVDPEMQIWITETGSAWGGGAEGLSDRFVAGFLWLDKLGLAAQLGAGVVVRQSLCGGYYSLIDCRTMEPHPDWWLSVLFKKLVGTRVLNVKMATRKYSVRLYAHCAQLNAQQGGIVLFGLNTDHQVAALNISNLSGPAGAYILTGETGLLSMSTLLNGQKLQLNSDDTLPPILPVNVSLDHQITMPPFSMGFWVTSGTFSICG